MLAKLALKDSELRYRRLFEAAQDGILILDAETGMITDVNPYLTKMLGYSREEFIQKKLWQVGAFKDIEASQNAFEALQQNEYIRYEDLPLKTKDGRLVQVEFVSNVYLVDGGKVIQCNIRDITARKQAEQKLRESEQRYRATLESMMEGCQIIGYDWRYLFVNASVVSQGKLKKEELLGHTMMECYPGIEKTDMFAVLRHCMDERTFHNIVNEFVYSDGSKGWFELSIQPEPNGIFILSSNITERKRAEEALRESEERYRQIIETAQEGIWTINADDQTTLVNQYLADMFGYTVEEIMSKSIFDFIDEEQKQNASSSLELRKLGTKKQLDFKFRHKDGSALWVLIETNSLHDQAGNYIGMLAMLTDITSRKHAEEALQESEAKFRSYIEYAPLGVFVVDGLGRYVEVNAAAAGMLGHTQAELLHLSILDVLAPQSLAAGLRQFQRVAQDGFATSDFLLRRKDGTQFWATVDAVRLSEDRFMSYCQDITGRKQAEEQLNGAHEFLQSVQDALSAHIAILDDEGNIVQVNSTWRDFGAQNGLRHSNHCIGMNYFDVCDSAKGPDAEEAALVAKAIREVRAGENDETQVEYPCHAPGRQRWFIAQITSFENNGRRWIVVAHENITARKQAEQALRESEERFRALVENNSNAITMLDAKGTVLYDSPAASGMLGYTPEDWIGENVFALVHPEDLAKTQALFQNLIETPGARLNSTFRVRHKSGAWLWLEIVTTNLLAEPAVKAMVLNYRDVTERMQAEERLRESDERFRGVWETTSDALALSDADGIVLTANPAYFHLYGYTAQQIIGSSFAIIFPEENRASAIEQYKLVFASDAILPTFESAIMRADGSERIVETHVTFLNAFGRHTAMLSSIRDITQRKQAEQMIQRQLKHLTALNTIDQVVASNFDLEISLSEILTHATIELGIDAADILILNAHMLEYSVERGFRAKAARRMQIRLSDSHAGRVVLERKLVKIPDLRDESRSISLETHWAGEDFVRYYGVPLIAKGQVKGVLEVFQRAAFAPDTEWFDFLNILAGRAAIAIENAMLFESLQRSNSELVLAYDATIEGWSRALDLRDKETEGHSLRVTQMTIKLARALGISEAELMQIRWGALLHDIGKMGVPDGILLKPGPLTDDEWVAMKKHPTFAHEMLSPIHYLRQALDIPYCHHEKWDGSGYPHGLKGIQIPLSARIFAVVDVYDALSSDRPYRPAWTKEKVREHILSSSGTHFDPQVVAGFMQMLN